MDNNHAALSPESLDSPLAEKPPFRSGFVGILGRPNVGKSTLLNSIVGEKIAIVSDKPQTTRNRIMGVKHLPDAQIVYLDTPGLHKPRSRLNERMVESALASLGELDLIYFVVEVGSSPGSGDRVLLDPIRRANRPVFLVLNKIDQVKKMALIPIIDSWARLFDFKEVVPISALTRSNLDRLIDITVAALPEGPAYYPEDVVTDRSLRFMAAETVREKILHRTRQEIPHVVAVTIEAFEEDTEKNITRIHATIYVERDTQKGILIGKSGSLLKAVGTEARQELEVLLKTKVYLELWVKVRKDWRDSETSLAEFGYTTESPSGLIL